eukprot:PRCOL_00006802-RA
MGAKETRGVPVEYCGVPVTSFPAPAREFLGAFDANGDGVIDLSELESAARMLEHARKGSLTVDMFPERLQDTVRALDDEGDGVLELDEITEMVEMYAALKEQNKTGEINISTLPKEIQPSLKVFDVDGDGTVAPMELARGAELYIESKKTVKKLTRLSVALLLLMGVMLAAITGLVFAVVELSKETSTGSGGVQTVKGGDAPVATAKVEERGKLFDLAKAKDSTLLAVTKLGPLFSGEDSHAFSVTGYSRMGGEVRFYTSSGSIVYVRENEYHVASAQGETIIPVTTRADANQRRRLMSDTSEESFTQDVGASIVDNNKPTPPKEWTCDPGYYAVGDGCDCNCGAPDPDCLTCEDDGTYQQGVFGCNNTLDRHSDIDFAATDDDGHLYREEGFDEMFPKSREWREFADLFYGADYDYSGTLPSLECKLDDVGVVTGAVYADAEVSFVMDGDETSALRFRSFSTTIERNN